MRTTICVLTLLALLAPGRAWAQDEHPVAQQVKEKVKDPAKPFTLGIRVKIKAGAGEKFEAAFAAARKETRKEKGNLAYDLNRSADEDTVYVLYERWADLAALQAHLKTPHVTKLFQEVGDLFEGQPELRVYLPVAE